MELAPLRDTPDALMVFDGACNLCSASVQAVLRMDREGVVSFASVQSLYGRALCEACGLDPGDPSTFLFFHRGQPLQASDAMLALLARMPQPWRRLALLRAIPRPVRDAAYLWLARNRYRLFGRRSTCLVPTPELKARFPNAPPAAG